MAQHAGYTLFKDVSDRDWRHRTSQGPSARASMGSVPSVRGP
jgi:2-keto-4-pentenoate hydratase/2-oxohepta-3-ene-1,7-dioic acid hydratase in catechol pathway